ncbi:MAG: putative signal transducing protein [Gaiellaceae bacterium]
MDAKAPRRSAYRVRVGRAGEGDVMFGVRLTVVRDESEAETICGLLRTEGIACDQRQTDMGAGAWEATGSGGPREVLVAASDLERARQLLDADAL